MSQEGNNMRKVCKNGCNRDAVMDIIFGELAEINRIPWCAHCIAPGYWNGDPYHHAESYSGTHADAPKYEKKCVDCGEQSTISVFEDDYCTECYNKRASRINCKPIKEPLGVMDDLIRKSYEKLGDPETLALYNRQPHYEGGIDPITFGQDNLEPKEMNGFYKMNVIKYVARCDRKNGLEDLQKAQDYLNLLIDSYKQQPDPKQTVEHMHNIDIYVNDLKTKGDTLIPREVGETVADMVADWANEHYDNVSCYECLDGYGVVVCNKKGRKSPLIKDKWKTEETANVVTHYVNLFKESERVTLEACIPKETKEVIVGKLRGLGYNLDIGIYGDGEMDISRA